MNIEYRIFWWGPRDEVFNNTQTLWYIPDNSGAAMQEFDPVNGQHSVSNLVLAGYREISWRTALTMGAPI